MSGKKANQKRKRTQEETDTLEESPRKRARKRAPPAIKPCISVDKVIETPAATSGRVIQLYPVVGKHRDRKKLDTWPCPGMPKEVLDKIHEHDPTKWGR